MYVSMSRNKLQGFLTQYMPQDWFKCLRKKEKVVSIFGLQRQGGRSQKKLLSSDWAENFADGNKGLILRPGAMAEGVERAAKRRMRPVGRRFCQGSVELVENLPTWFHFDVPLPERKLSV